MLAAVAVAGVSLGGAVWWVVAGVQGPIVRTRFDAIPPYVMNGMQTPQHPRLLAMDLSDGHGPLRGPVR